MSNIDTHIHVANTVMGMSFNYGQRTLTTGCGKRRDQGRVSTDPAKVTCPECRKWAAEEEMELAWMADAAASLDQALIETIDPRPSMTPGEFRQMAEQHRAMAQKWSA